MGDGGWCEIECTCVEWGVVVGGVSVGCSVTFGIVCFGIAFDAIR